MHRRRPPQPAAPVGFPRRRGDAPSPDPNGPPQVGFPPQARGCTPAERRTERRRDVSPAGAGMHRRRFSPPVPLDCFPRRRGDAPSSAMPIRGRALFPPQARGCTAARRVIATGTGVSPAGAGMHRAKKRKRRNADRFPRRRGDAPAPAVLVYRSARFPPQARGCTTRLRGRRARRRVSPAGAGMHRIKTPPALGLVGFPRRRGDAPGRPVGRNPVPPFPPQARGCTSDSRLESRLSRVSPAGAGMHPGSGPLPPYPLSFPRRRGDAPLPRRVSGADWGFPPQARGCTFATRRRPARPLVSPAGAGMHPPTG